MRSGFEFRVVLNANIEGMVVELENFAPLSRFILTDKDHSRSFNFIDQVRIDLVSVSVTLVNGIAIAVQ